MFVEPCLRRRLLLIGPPSHDNQGLLVAVVFATGSHGFGYQPSHGAPIKVPNWLCRCELSCCHMAVAELVVALPFCCTRLFVLH